jgi:hypothetical protein
MPGEAQLATHVEGFVRASQIPTHGRPREMIATPRSLVSFSLLWPPFDQEIRLHPVSENKLWQSVDRRFDDEFLRSSRKLRDLDVIIGHLS